MSQFNDFHSADPQHAVKGSEVFVGGLPRTVSEDTIRQVFSTCGEIVEIRLIKDQQGNLKGYCFVRFSTKEAADKAVKDKSNYVLDGKKIGVLPSMEQDTLFLGNLNKVWSADDFEKIVHQVFPDVVSVELAMLGDVPPGQKYQNRGFGFVKFSSHSAAARAYRVGSKADFRLGGTLHPTVKWAEEEPEIDPDELAKIKIAFVRNLPTDADEYYLKKMFEPFGKVDRIVVSKKTSASVGFVHFDKRSDLDKAIREMDERTVQGPNGGPAFKLQVEVARPMDRNKKRTRDDTQNKLPSSVQSHSKLAKEDAFFSSSGGYISSIQKKQEMQHADPYEVAVIALTAAVKERLLRILRLGIATRFDIDIQSLTSLKELPEPAAISVLDQFMLSGADVHHKGEYLSRLISRHQVDKFRPSQFPVTLSRTRDVSVVEPALSSLSSRPRLRDVAIEEPELSVLSSRYRSRDIAIREPEFSGLSSRVHLPAVDSFTSRVGSTIPRVDTYSSRYSSAYLDHVLSGGSALEKKEERSPPLTTSPPASYGRGGFNSHVAAPTDRRPQMRFDPFTGEPYKFDPFTGEPILPETQTRRF